MSANNFAHHWCEGMIAQLFELDVDHFFVAPGSRSTPIVSALARNKNCKVFLGFDERSVGFMALGYGKRAQKAGAVVVTSGTAVSNLYPAVTEAFLSEVPLLLLTADRPYELRDCGANQTIFQANLFANHINRSYDLAPPAPVVSLSRSLAMIEQAISYTEWPKKGPVHINIQLREPLANVPHKSELPWNASELMPTRSASISRSRMTIDADELVGVFAHRKGLLVVGELAPSDCQEKILVLSERLGWPIFADITSNLRLRHHPNILHQFELALLSERFKKTLRFDAVVKFGARVVSKRFWAWIEHEFTGDATALNESFERVDHTGRFKHIVIGDLSSALAGILKSPRLAAKPSWNAGEIQASLGEIRHAVLSFLENKEDNEGYMAARLIAQIREPVEMFVSSSMPIRDLDQFAHPTHVPVDLYSNRGASGIDGIISSAVGVAVASTKPTILLMGDLAFLHDTNGLALMHHAKAPVLIVVINNGGGGIFHLLPIAEEKDVITPYLDTPHDISIEFLCKAHKIPHQLISNPKSYDEALRHFFSERKTMVLEVVVKREPNVSLHKEVYQKIARL